MILFKTLDKIDNHVLHKTFVEAFSDYQVKIDLPFWKFQQMIQRRGYDPKISIGAFNDSTLVGFALNGLRSWNEKATVYDIATGVVPEYRRQGITSNMFLHIKELLKEKHVEQYLLEVIKSNQPAVQLYQKQGFEIQREFSCFQLERSKFISKETYKVEKVNKIDFEQIKDFWDYKPSWQNSIDSIYAVPESFAFLVVRHDNIIIGYGVVDKRTGDIAQVAVNKNYRGKGIASSIISKMFEIIESKKVGILNVEIGIESIEKFLIELGFECDVNQFEMLLNL